MIFAYVGRLLPSELLGRADIILLGRSERKDFHPWWRKGISRAVMGYADQQIVTAIAVLTAGFVRMRSLSIYHLHVVIYLAWMSSNTHLTAVSLLQHEFRNQKARTLKVARLVGMSVVGIMILVALIPTTGTIWSQMISSGGTAAAGVPAQCFWQIEAFEGFNVDSIWSFLILVGSFAWKGPQLFRSSNSWLKGRRTWLLEKISTRLDRLLNETRAIGGPSFGLKFRYRLNFLVFFLIWVVFELLQCFLTSILICCGGLAWGTTQILALRSTVDPKVLKEENTWGFGQLLPVLLLAVPFLAYADGLFGEHLSPTLRSEFGKV